MKFTALPDDANGTFFKRRQLAFYGSATHFMRTLVNGNWENSGFVLFRDDKPANPNTIFSVSYDYGFYSVGVMLDDASHEAPKKGLDPRFASRQLKQIDVKYRATESSTLHFNRLNFTVDANGTTGNAYDIAFQGEMAKLRVGDLLPSDYLP